MRSEFSIEPLDDSYLYAVFSSAGGVNQTCDIECFRGTQRECRVWVSRKRALRDGVCPE